MVIGYGNNPIILQQCIKVLDDEDIDFFIHWDKRYKIPSLNIQKGNIFYVKNRIAVKWGSNTQMKAECLLFNLVLHANRNYEYVHLISCNDLPLMTADYFKNYFKKSYYIGFKHPTPSGTYKRISYYYPNNVDFRRHKNIKRFYTLIYSTLRINRLKNIPNLKVKKGPQWFSAKENYLEEIVKYKYLNKFNHSFCVDEVFLQTILARLDTNNSENDNYQAARYIDWKRGFPYVFQAKDIPELKSMINTRFAFVRKIKDPKIGKKLYDI